MLTPAAVAFVEDLTRRFRPRIDELLARRRVTQERFNKGGRPDVLTDTADVMRGDWKVAPAPVDLQDRRVEITGPVDRKMIINALNSGAQVFMADFEDANSPTWANATLDDGRTVTRPLVEQLIAEELGRVREEVGAARFDRGRFADARALFEQLATSGELEDFFTLPAYEILVKPVAPL